MIRFPGFDPGAGNGDDAFGGKGFSQQLPLTLDQFHQHQTVFRIDQGGPDLQGGQIRRGDIQVLDVALFPDIQPDLPVQTAVGQIVDDETEGRDLAMAQERIKIEALRAMVDEEVSFRKLFQKIKA